jgi:hypothetical protein
MASVHRIVTRAPIWVLWKHGRTHSGVAATPVVIKVPEKRKDSGPQTGSHHRARSKIGASIAKDYLMADWLRVGTSSSYGLRAFDPDGGHASRSRGPCRSLRTWVDGGSAGEGFHTAVLPRAVVSPGFRPPSGPRSAHCRS